MIPRWTPEIPRVVSGNEASIALRVLADTEVIILKAKQKLIIPGDS